MSQTLKHGVIKLMIQSLLKIKGPTYLIELKEKNGNVFFLKSGSPHDKDVTEYLFAFDPIFVEEIYTKQYKNFIKAGGWHKLRKALGNGLLTSEEPIHLEHRRILNPGFHVKKINAYASQMHDLIKIETNSWINKEEIDLNDSVTQLTYSILTNTIFNNDMQENFNDLKKIFFIILEKAGKGETSTPGSMDKYGDDLKNLMDKVIKKRLDSPNKEKDFLDLLIDASISDSKITLQDVSDEVLTMLLAGHETTASTVTWAICHLSLNKEFFEIIKKESLEYSKKAKDGDQISLLKDLKFSKYVINEILRLYPPVWFSPRTAICDTQIKDTFIPKGTRVILSSYVMQRDEKYFEHPNEFLPMRWDNGLENNLPEGVFWPFHLGPRKCIGYQFALMQSQISLLEIFSKMNIELLEGMPEGLAIATYRPLGEIKVKIKKDVQK
jgi:cytochrome P450